ncbi:MAG: hypothetical protein GSR86_05930 [Desulfurococcales archaeon]|nr:hypothetical protein [Desulfurococcales archaeon]
MIRFREVDEAIPILKSMGISLVGIEMDMFNDVARRIHGHNIKVVPRITLTPSTTVELRRRLRRVPRNTLVAVRPGSLEVARRAAAIRGVHLIQVSRGTSRIVDRSTHRLFKARGYGAVELVLNPLVSDFEGYWRFMESVVRRAYAYGVPLVISSGAGSVWELWHPRSVSGLLELAGVPPVVGLSWLSNTVHSIVSSILGV